MPKEVRIGIIGCGKIADCSHIPGYLALKGAKIVALMDVKRSQMTKARANHGLDDVEEFTHLNKLLASDVEAVSICTPNNFHYPQTMASLKAGKHVLCEKPMAATLPECTRMIDMAKKSLRVLQINQTLRYLPLYQKIAEVVAEGEIGTPIHVRCIRSGATSPDKGWSPGAKWFVQKKHQGGVVLDIAVHMADMMQWVAGDIQEIAAYVDTRARGIDVPDNATALMRFTNGATGVLELSWTTPVGAGMLEIYGTRGTLRQGFSDEIPIEVIKPNPKGGKPTISHPKPKDTARDSFECFLEAVRGKMKSPTPGRVGRDAIALCDAIAKSGKSGRFVKVRSF